jgi:hypothetical protein
MSEAAKRRKNAAHGASRRRKKGSKTSPSGAKEQFLRALFFLWRLFLESPRRDKVLKLAAGGD